MSNNQVHRQMCHTWFSREKFLNSHVNFTWNSHDNSQLITEKCEYAVESADRPKPTAVFYITEVDWNTPWLQMSSRTHMVHQQRHIPSGKNTFQRDIQISNSKSCKSLDRNALINYQIFILNLNMPKTKWNGSEDPAINNVYNIDNRTFWICS